MIFLAFSTALHLKPQGLADQLWTRMQKINLKNFKIDTYNLIQLEHFDENALELECDVITNRFKYTS